MEVHRIDVKCPKCGRNMYVAYLSWFKPVCLHCRKKEERKKKNRK